MQELPAAFQQFHNCTSAFRQLALQWAQSHSNPEITNLANMTSTIRPTKLNNCGVFLMSLGRIEEAAQTFKQGLKATRDLIRARSENEEDDIVESGSCESQGSLTPETWVLDQVTPDGNSFLVYNVPQRIEESNSDVSLHTISATIIFNLALAHHLKALSESASEAAFSTAIQLYEHTYRLMMRETPPDCFIVLAVLNNLAHIHYKTRNLEDAERICGVLWSAAIQAENEDKEKTSSGSTSSPFEGFFANVLHVTFKPSQSAAAA